VSEMAKKSNTGKKKVDVISLDNKPINPEVQKEKVEVPTKFVKVVPTTPKTAESKIKLNNGRVYKNLGNGYCMYADNGEVFRK
jgi:hypothetical protein